MDPPCAPLRTRECLDGLDGGLKTDPRRGKQFKVKDRWQPLTEHDDLGYIFSQMHVTPHIGAMARFYGFNSSEGEEEFSQRELPDPDYE